MNRREIKFKVWCKENEQFIQFNKMGFSEDGSLWYVQGVDENEEETDPPYFENQNDWGLMQYTGLKDKNGVEIYTGDIVKRTYLFDGAFGRTHTGEVVYDKEYARYVISNPQKYTEPKNEDLRNTLSDKSIYEVIGNIYQHHALLEGEAE